MPQQAPPVRILDRDALEFASVDAPDPVVTRQGLVHERVVRSKEVEDVPIAPEHAVEEEFGFPTHGILQNTVKLGEFDAIGNEGLKVAKVEPLAAKIAHQRLGTRVRQRSGSKAVPSTGKRPRLGDSNSSTVRQGRM